MERSLFDNRHDGNTEELRAQSYRRWLEQRNKVLNTSREYQQNVDDYLEALRKVYTMAK